MAIEQGPHEFDLDRTDRLPILTGITIEGLEELDDDPSTSHALTRVTKGESYDVDLAEATGRMRAVSVDMTGLPSAVGSGLAGDFIRPSSVDLPSLAESVRTVEERISRQHSEYEALNRNYERARDAESLAIEKAASFEREMLTLRGLLESEQARLRELEKGLQERTREQEITLKEHDNAADAARAKAEEALRDAERFRSESSTLKDTLVAREATISQVSHNLGERDAQLENLKQEHAKAQQSLELRGKSHGELEDELTKHRATVQELSLKLKSAEEQGTGLGQKLKRDATEINALRSELGSTRATSHSYLEVLSSREFRRGFDENLFMELDAKVGTSDVQQAQLKAERDRAEASAANLEVTVASQTITIEKLQQGSTTQVATLAQQLQTLQHLETAKEQLTEKLASVEQERDRLSTDLAERTIALEDARAAATGDVKRMTDQLAAGEIRLKEFTVQISQLQMEHAETVTRLHGEHTDKLSLLQADNTTRFTKMQSEHMAITSAMQSDHAEIVSRMQKDQASQLAEMQGRHAGILKDLSKESQEREQEMSVLMGHVKEARRPLDPILADVKRLTDELAVKSRAVEQLSEEAQTLRGALDRTKGALEEREFLIRRLERAESNNANVLGRIQTSMERLGSSPIVGAPVVEQPEFAAEMIRVDGDREVSHSLSRRTRIGRAHGCELQIDSSSVSRHHALIVAGPRETIIEDLHSTNGVIVNGRKISRAFLNDGDIVLIGDLQFRYVSKSAPRQERSPIEVQPAD